MTSFSTKRLSRIAIAIAVIIVCSQITVPLPGVPFTLQTLAIGLIACLLTPTDALIACLAYLFLGAIGLPVFAGGSGGFASFTGSGGGFLIGFLFFTFLTSLMTQKTVHFGRLLLALLIGDSLAFLCGWLGLISFLHLSPSAAFWAGVAPFILGDGVKMVIVALLAKRLRPILSR